VKRDIEVGVDEKCGGLDRKRLSIRLHLTVNEKMI
jgi:hypothetical protein